MKIRMGISKATQLEMITMIQRRRSTEKRTKSHRKPNHNRTAEVKTVASVKITRETQAQEPYRSNKNRLEDDNETREFQAQAAPEPYLGNEKRAIMTTEHMKP